MGLFNTARPLGASATNTAPAGIPVAALFKAIQAKDSSAEMHEDSDRHFVVIRCGNYAGGVVNLYGVHNGLASSAQLRTWLQDPRVLAEKLNTANAWNREHRFIKVYLDKDGDFAAEMDLLADGADPIGTLMQEVERRWHGSLLLFASKQGLI